MYHVKLVLSWGGVIFSKGNIQDNYIHIAKYFILFTVPTFSSLAHKVFNWSILIIFIVIQIEFFLQLLQSFLKSITSREHADFLLGGEAIEDQDDFIAHLEARFLYLAADARSTLRSVKFSGFWVFVLDSFYLIQTMILYLFFYFHLLVNLIHTKLLNLIGWGCPSFLIERDALPSLFPDTWDRRCPKLCWSGCWNDGKTVLSWHMGWYLVLVSYRMSPWDLNF